MRRYILLVSSLLLMGLFSPFESSIGVVTAQSNGGVVPSSTSHTVTVTNPDCRMLEGYEVEVECGETGSRTRSKLTIGNLSDVELPDCEGTFEFTDVCLREESGAIDDVIRVYHKGRNAAVYRKSVTVTSPSSLVFTYVITVPEFGAIPFDPTLGVGVSGGADADYVWLGDCDNDPATPPATDDPGFEVTFADVGSALNSGNEPGCPEFVTSGEHVIRIRAKDEAGPCGGGNECGTTQVTVTAEAPTVDIESFTPSVTFGTAPLNEVEFTLATVDGNTCPSGGVYSWIVACDPSYLSGGVCAGGDNDCNDDDGCCAGILGGVSPHSTTDTNFDCDYAADGIYHPTGIAYCTSGGVGYTSVQSTITVGAPASFTISPVTDVVTGDTTTLFTMTDPVCSGTAAGALTSVFLDWELGDATPAADVTADIDANCQWTAAPTHTYTTSGPKTIQLTATRQNVSDHGEIQVQVNAVSLLNGVLTTDVTSGASPQTVTASVDFYNGAGACAGPKTITNSTYGTNCTGNFNVSGTVADPYTDPSPATCTTGTSIPAARLWCAGANPVDITGDPIVLGTEATFGITPVPTVLVGTAGVTTVALSGVTCTGTAVGAITATTPVPGEPPELGISMEDGVDPLVPATISNLCVLANPGNYSKVYTTPGEKRIKICAMRQNVLSCNTTSIQIAAQETLGATITPSGGIAGDGTVNDVDIDFVFTGSCPGPWVISDSSCGAFGLPTSNAFNGQVTDDVPGLPYTHKFPAACDFLAGSSTPKGDVACGTATPLNDVISSIPVVVEDPIGSDVFSIDLNVTPTSGPVGTRFVWSVTCNGSASLVHPIDAPLTWLGPVPGGYGNYIRIDPYTSPAPCPNYEIFYPIGELLPEGTWTRQICATVDGASDCSSPVTVYVGSSTPTSNFISSSPVPTVNVQTGTTTALANQITTLLNAGTATGSYVCTTPDQPGLLGAGIPITTINPFKQIAGVAGQNLAAGNSTSFVWSFDHRGADGIAGNADDVLAGTYQALLHCENTENVSNVVEWIGRVDVTNVLAPDLETSPQGTNSITFTLVERSTGGGAAPASQSLNLTSIGGAPADFTVSGGAYTRAACTSSGTAPMSPSTTPFTCTTTDGITATQCPVSSPCTTTKTITRLGSSTDTETVVVSVSVLPYTTTSGVEERCSSLGSSCICNELLNSPTHDGGSTQWDWSSTGWGVNNSLNWRPDGSPKSCIGLPYAEAGCISTPGVAPVPAASAGLPAGHSLSYVLRHHGSGICQVGHPSGTMPIATGSTYCMRHYRRWDPTTGWPSSDPLANSQQKVITIGGWVPATQSFLKLQMTIGTSGYIRSSFDYGALNASSGTYDQGSAPTECVNNWCRFEICLDMGTDGIVTGRRSITRIVPGATPRVEIGSGTIRQVGDLIWTDTAGGGLALYTLGYPDPAGSFDYSTTYMVAQLPYKDGNFWIGCAEEVEGPTCTH